MLTKLIAGVSPLVLYASAAQAKFLPDNNLHLQDTLASITSIDQSEFNAVIDEAEAFYGPVISEQFGARLRVNRLWTDSTVNASASRSGSTWSVNMYGGLARRPEVTRDGFALVLCHEIGHHVGGYPFYSGNWAASEGQSDYFATISCARELWRDDLSLNATFRESVNPYAKELCDSAWVTDDDQNLCYRTMAGGKSLADLLSALGGTTSQYETPDTATVSRTSTSHPAGQCRLDTYMAGALCNDDNEWDANVIPGVQGSNSSESERQSVPYTCSRTEGYTGYTEGTRPTCWFKSLLATDTNPPTDPGDTLESGQPVENLSGGRGSETKFTVVLSEASDLSINISGGTGDADLYVRFGSEPTTSSYDCRPYASGNDETCNFSNASGTYYIMVRGYRAYSGLTIVADY